MNHKIPTDEDCFICGDELVALSDSTTGVTDGDEVICEACGAEAWISADEDGAGVSYDEMSAHNVLCAERYEAIEDLAARDATIEKLWALARKMAGDTAKAQWTDDDEEMRLLFLRAVDDGDLETACAALGVADE